MEEQDIIEDLIKFNIPLLAKTRFKLCDENPRHSYCKPEISPASNTYDNWVSYLDKNRNLLFEKGKERLETLKALLKEPPFLYFIENPDYNVNNPNDTNILKELQIIKETKLDKYYFILASLIIIFQVFSDGNHRTANEFYRIYTGNNISPKQFEEIKNIRYNNRYDYTDLESNPEIIKQIISELERIHLTGGSKRKKSKRTKKTKRRKIIKNKKTKRR